MSEEERFEAWFQERRRATWGNGYGEREGQPVPPNWSMGLRRELREGWMARAALAGAADQPKAVLSPRGNPCLNDPCLRAKDGSECFPCDHADAASTNSPEVSSGLVGSTLPEFWQLAKLDDGRAVVYVTEEQWDVLRACWIPDSASDNSPGITE